MAKILKLLVFSMFLLACTEKPTTEFTNTQQFSKELDQLQSFFQIPGLAVVVQKEDSVIFEAYQGYADIEQQLPVQKNTKFPIASITKVAATWCPPCVAEMPSFLKLYEDYGDKVDFFFVANDKKDKVTAFLQKKGYEFPVYFEKSRGPELLSSNSIPATFILNKSGEIVVDERGVADWNSDSTRALLDTLIAE